MSREGLLSELRAESVNPALFCLQYCDDPEWGPIVNKKILSADVNTNPEYKTGQFIWHYATSEGPQNMYAQGFVENGIQGLLSPISSDGFATKVLLRHLIGVTAPVERIINFGLTLGSLRKLQDALSLDNCVIQNAAENVFYNSSDRFEGVDSSYPVLPLAEAYDWALKLMPSTKRDFIDETYARVMPLFHKSQDKGVMPERL